MLESNININCTLRNGTTPLYLAAHLSSVENVQKFIRNGANIDAQQNNHYTPLMEASYKGFILLLDAGAKPSR